MASRKKAWMAHKLAIMARQRKRDPIDVTKTRAGHTIEASNRMSAELGSMVERFNGVATVGETGPRLPVIGKKRASLDTRTFGNGARRVGRAADYYSLWSTEDRLIPAAR